jgi:hypothetical protein
MESSSRNGTVAHKQYMDELIHINMAQGDVLEKNIKPNKMNVSHYGMEVDLALVEREKIKNLENKLNKSKSVSFDGTVTMGPFDEHSIGVWGSFVMVARLAIGPIISMVF